MQGHSSDDKAVVQSIESLQLRLGQECESRDVLMQRHAALQKKHDELESKYRESQTRSQFLSNENSLLTAKLSEQISLRSKLQLSKEEMAEELEELTRSLFEEANELVAKEAKARHETEAALSKALDELAQLRVAFKDESSQLRELKERMKDMISASGGHLPPDLPRRFPAEAAKSGCSFTSPVHYFLSLSEPGHQHVAAASSIWHYISWKGLQDVWPETFEEWKNVIYYKPSPELVCLELEKQRGKEHQATTAALSRERDAERVGLEFAFEPEDEVPDMAESACLPHKSSLAARRINPRWILEQLDSDLYVEFLHWLGRSSVPEPVYHAPLASSSSNLSLPSLLVEPAEFVSRPSTPQKTLPAAAILTSRSSSYSLSHEASKQASSSSSSSDPFMRRAWEEDVLPTLSFPRRSKSFSKKLMKSIASNSMSLEAVFCPARPASSLGSFPSCTLAPPSASASTSASLSALFSSSCAPTAAVSAMNHCAASPLSSHAYSTPLSSQPPSVFVSPAPPAGESFASPSSILAAGGSLSAYSSSPPAAAASWIPIRESHGGSPRTATWGRPTQGSGMADSPRSEIHDFIERARTASPDPSLNGTACSLCGRPIRPLPPRLADAVGMDELDAGEPLVHRLRLSDDESSASSLLIDSHCRAKIVSVCDFFSFVRYYRQGFYTSFTNEHLYAHWLQLKRAMMYARTGSTSYFVASDVSLLMRRWHQGWHEWHSTHKRAARLATSAPLSASAPASTLAADKRASS